MNLKETFEQSRFESASKVTEVYRFFHKGRDSWYRLEIAEEFSTGRYTAKPYREVEDEDTGRITLETLIDFPWVDQPTAQQALHDGLDFLADRLK
jgi:hypothetical protein